MDFEVPAHDYMSTCDMKSFFGSYNEITLASI